MLHDPERHEPLEPIAWDAARAQAAIGRIVRDTEARRLPNGDWPLHPLDDDGSGAAAPTDLYLGSIGVVWALNYLSAVGAATLQRAPADLDALLERHRAWLAAAGLDAAGAYLIGELPLQMMIAARQPTPEAGARLAALIEGQFTHPSRELMWGAPGALLAALFLHERSGDARWAELFRRGARDLMAERESDPDLAWPLWTQSLYGRRSRYLGAAHGFAGAVLPLVRGRRLLDPQDWACWQAWIADTARHFAQAEGDGLNWPPEAAPPGAAAQKRLMQICHGAPGMLVCLAGLPEPALDELLLAAGRAIWAAGPLAKGSNLCHGSSGNGYAFLKLHARTADPLWLARARAFAMHAIAQAEAAAAEHGQGRYSLWTGDLGLAVYLWDCLRGGADFPTLDVFDAPRR
ncbi:MAG TPA: LanC-like protein [Methylibium sp.]|nr:LanC-like protein [Methylibium sp.]